MHDRRGASTPALTDIGAGLQGPSGLAASVYAAGSPMFRRSRSMATAVYGWRRPPYQDDGADAVYLVATRAPHPPGSSPTSTRRSVSPWADDALYVASAGRVDAYADLDGLAFATIGRS